MLAGCQGQGVWAGDWFGSSRYRLVIACGGGTALLDDARRGCPLTAMPWSFAHARIPPLRFWLAAVRPGRRGCPWLALRACSMKSASLRPNGVAFLAQADLILGAADPEPDRPIRRPDKDRLPARRLSSVPFPPPRLRSAIRTGQDQLSCRGDHSATSPQSPSSRSIPGPPGSRYHVRQAAGLKEPTQEPTATGSKLHRARPSPLRRRQMPRQATFSIFQPPSGRTF
jgi:hypothetical protein